MLADESLLKLVVIDDEPDIARLISDVADIAGYEVAAYFEAGDFIAQYDGSADIIFLDLMMPKISGIDVIRFLAERKSCARLVLMTGFDVEALRAAQQIAVSSGLNFVSGFNKPFRFGELNAMLGNMKSALRPRS